MIAELTGLVAEHPFRERLQAALMLALYRSGRRADALAAYRSARESMVEELGLDPGRRLQELERAMLVDSPSLQLDPARDDEPAGVPDTLPAPAESAAARPSRRRRIAVTLLAVTAVAVAALVAGLALFWPRPSSPGCTKQQMMVVDLEGHLFEHVYQCGTIVDEAIYANPQDDAPLAQVSLTFESANAWVVCQVAGRTDPVIAGRHSRRWLYTRGDTETMANPYGYTNSWGFLPATAVRQAPQDRPVPGVPACSPDYVVPGPPDIAPVDQPTGGPVHDNRFVFTAVRGTTDMAAFVYVIDGGPRIMSVASSGTAIVRLPAIPPGPHELSVWVRRRSGGESRAGSYTFTSG